MNTIKILKITGIVLGASALVVGGILLYRKFKRDDDFTDYQPPGTSGSGLQNSSTTSGYSSSEIKGMQTWLIRKATAERNNVILEAIRTTGGIDGIIGPGFNTALREAIAKGYVQSLKDLYNQSISNQ